LDKYKQELERIQNDPRFTIYQNDVPICFIKMRRNYTWLIRRQNFITYEMVPQEEEAALYDYRPKH